jgi:hypothetical protein
MKRNVACLLSVCVLILPLAGCKFLGHPDYELSVSIEPGVTGTPAAGVYTHTELDEVEYAYTPVNSKHTVEVLVDGGQEDADSSLIIYKNTALVARLFDVRKTWKITYYVTDNSTALDFTITLTGSDILGGDFSDSRGHHGTWDASSGVLTFTFSDFESYKYTGALLDMSGTWSNGTITGTWSASLP